TETLDGKPAPLQVGDRVLMLDGKSQLDFTKIALETALMRENEWVPMLVERRNGTKEELRIKPARLDLDPKFVMLGIGASPTLEAPKREDERLAEIRFPDLSPPEFLALRAGDAITAVNGQPVTNREFWKLDEALQNSAGKPVTVSVRGADGAVREIQV